MSIPAILCKHCGAIQHAGNLVLQTYASAMLCAALTLTDDKGCIADQPCDLRAGMY